MTVLPDEHSKMLHSQPYIVQSVFPIEIYIIYSLTLPIQQKKKFIHLKIDIYINSLLCSLQYWMSVTASKTVGNFSNVSTSCYKDYDISFFYELVWLFNVNDMRQNFLQTNTGSLTRPPAPGAALTVLLAGTHRGQACLSTTHHSPHAPQICIVKQYYKKKSPT